MFSVLLPSRDRESLLFGISEFWPFAGLLRTDGAQCEEVARLHFPARCAIAVALVGELQVICSGLRIGIRIVAHSSLGFIAVGIAAFGLFDQFLICLIAWSVLGAVLFICGTPNGVAFSEVRVCMLCFSAAQRHRDAR